MSPLYSGVGERWKLCKFARCYLLPKGRGISSYANAINRNTRRMRREPSTTFSMRSVRFGVFSNSSDDRHTSKFLSAAENRLLFFNAAVSDTRTPTPVHDRIPTFFPPFPLYVSFGSIPSHGQSWVSYVTHLRPGHRPIRPTFLAFSHHFSTRTFASYRRRLRTPIAYAYGPTSRSEPPTFRDDRLATRYYFIVPTAVAGRCPVSVGSVHDAVGAVEISTTAHYLNPNYTSGGAPLTPRPASALIVFGFFFCSTNPPNTPACFRWLFFFVDIECVARSSRSQRKDNRQQGNNRSFNVFFLLFLHFLFIYYYFNCFLQ